uniref:Uncharacterized protein n=1 Tax=viral metagenome TaxID=1070528 RepID=A0A6C0BCV8_9ZZZZ
MITLITWIELHLNFIDYENEIDNVEVFIDNVEIGFSTFDENYIRYDINVIWQINEEIELIIRYNFNNSQFEEKIFINMGNIYKQTIRKYEELDHRDRYCL